MKIGRKLIRLDVVDSTNNYIANLIKEGAIDSGTVIMADEQFAGKGQRTAEWLTNAGENLTFSFFLDDVNLSVNRQFLLSKIVALSIVDFLRNFEMTAEIKWPNDIYVNGKKIAGVLIENQIRGGQIQSSIIGIGLNLNQISFSGFSATSIKLEIGQHILPQDAVFSFISAFNDRIVELYHDSLHSDYLEKLFQRNMLSKYIDETGEFEGIIEDVLENGQLLLLKNGIEAHYDIKEITFL